MDPETLIMCIIGLLLILTVGIPIVNSLASSSSSASYTEMPFFIANASTPATHYISSISSLKNLTVVWGAMINTTDPGTANFTLSSVPDLAVLLVSGGGSGTITINGNSIGALNGSGPYQFLVPASDLNAGVNTVVFG